MADVQRFHSAIRWGKPVAELQPFVSGDKSVVNASDEKNGNQAIHLSAQNGHVEITKWLVDSCGAEKDGQNGKGQTALHMSVAYDFYDQTAFLLSRGADPGIKNGDGHAAIGGIDGDKVGKEVWNSPLNQLKGVKDKASMEVAFAAIKAAPKGDLDKAMLVQTGMGKKKAVPEWDQPAFMELMKAL